VRLLRYPPRESVKNPLGYILRVATNVLNDFRARDHQDTIPFDPSEENEYLDLAADFWAVEGLESRVEQEQWVESILRQLSPLHQALVLMCKRDGLSYAEAGQKLEVPANTIKRHLADAIALFEVFASRG
jgi:RNA polymerase sigma factor (sigma-70 family)